MSLRGRNTGGSGRGLLVVALAAFVMLGLADGSLGVGWPSMRAAFDRGISDLGVLLGFLSVGYLTASTGYGRVHSYLGTGVSLGVGCSFMALGLAGVALGPEWAVVTASSALLGVGGGLVDAGMNAHAALEFDVGSINLLHASYGVGATFGPLLIAFSLGVGAAWRGGYAILAICQVGIAVTVWNARRRWAASPRDPNGEPESRSRGGRVGGLLMLFFIYTGVEVATGQWAFTLLSEGRGIATAVAGGWVAAFWGGLTVGRFVFGVVGDRVAASRILDGSMAVALVGIGILWWDPSGLGAMGLPVAGLGLAAVFPTMVSLTPARIGRLASTKVIGYQLAAANVGAASVPWLLGLTAESYGLAALGPGLFGVAALAGVVHLWTDRAPASALDL